MKKAVFEEMDGICTQVGDHQIPGQFPAGTQGQQRIHIFLTAFYTKKHSTKFLYIEICKIL